jgi:phosphohistidine phosphatase
MGLLIIMRHAEATSAAPRAEDFNRPLTSAGRATAEQTARRILGAHGLPELVLHSPALRTAETARIVVQTWADARTRVQVVPAIYLARGSTLQQLLDQPEHSAASVLLIGHNPGVSELLRALDNVASDQRRWLTPAEFVALTS